MKQRMTSLIAICAFAGLATPAFADCQQELAELRGQSQSMDGEGISKDGSMAPLESDNEDTSAPTDTGSDTAANSSGSQSGSSDADSDMDVAKDGSETPLNTDLSNRATSGQDAAAQQDGEAAAQGAMSPEAEEALARAEEALEAGDEAACMDAVEEARTL